MCCELTPVLPPHVQAQKETGRKLRAMAAQMERDERLIAELRGAAAEAQAHAQRCDEALRAAEGRLRDIETRGRGEKAVDATPAVADAATTTADAPIVMVARARAPSSVPSSPQQPQQQPQPQPQQPQQQQAQQPLPQQEQQHSLQAEREWEERRAMQVRPI